MFLYSENGNFKLPDITMYGGDTTPWYISIMKQDGTPYPFGSLTGSSAKLFLSPYALSVGIGNDAQAAEPVLTKSGTVTGDPDGNGTILFTMERADTIDLRGKYLYQIEISRDDDLRVLQGVVTIRPNINRA